MATDIIAYRISELGEQALVIENLAEGLATYLGDPPHSVGAVLTVEVISTTRDVIDALPEWQS